MKDFKDDLRSAGYSQEEAYFYKLNRELTEKVKRKFRLIKGGKADSTAVATETRSSASQSQSQNEEQKTWRKAA